MVVRAGYRQTEIGVVPEEWELEQIARLESRRLVKLGRGQVISRLDIERTPGDFPIYSSSVHNEGEFGRYGHFMFDEELITWSIDGGGHFFWRPKHKFSVTNVCGFMRVDSERICYAFLAAVLQLLHSRKSFDYQSKAHPSVIRKEYAVPLPALAEQRAIAAALSDVDALLGGLDRLIAKKRDLKQAAMQQLLTGQTRLPGFSGAWEVKRLGEVVQIQKGQLITSSTLLPGDIPVIAGGKQPAYFHATANRYGRTITISASGASAGYVALYDEPIFASDCSTISESEAYCLDFVFYQLLCEQQTIYKAQTGGAQPHIHAKDLNPILFSFPTVPEQTAIAAVLSDMDAELAALEARRDKTRDLKQAMMQELLTGKTRLVKPEAAHA